MPSLNELSLEELKELADDLASLAKVGQSLAPLHPIFDLTPGQPFRITLDQVMPDTWAKPSTADQIAKAIEAARKERSRPVAMTGPFSGTTDLPASTEAAQPEPAPGPVEPLAAGDTAGGTLSAEPSRSGGDAAPPPLAKAAPPEAVADSGGGVAMAAADSAPAATHERTFTRGPDWTAEEDARLIDLVVKAVGMGATKKAGMIAAAKELGRPEAATQFRCHHKLKARLDAALTEAAMRQAQTETPEIPEAARQDAPPPQAEVQGEGAVPQEGDAPALEPEASAGASFVADPVTAHLMALTDKGGWTVEHDLDLMGLSILGWPPHEIATQLQMPDKAIKPRFDMLTGLHDDEATGKKVRRFTRESVFAALSRLAGRAA